MTVCARENDVGGTWVFSSTRCLIAGDRVSLGSELWGSPHLHPAVL